MLRYSFIYCLLLLTPCFFHAFAVCCFLRPYRRSRQSITGGDHRDAQCRWRLSSKTWYPITSPWMKQLAWLRIVHSGDWCLRLALYTLQKRRRRRRRRTSLRAMQAPPVLTCFTVTRRINWYHRYRAINIWK